MSEDREHFIWQNNVHVDFKGNEIWINLVVNRWFIFLDIKNSIITLYKETFYYNYILNDQN